MSAVNSVARVARQRTPRMRSDAPKGVVEILRTSYAGSPSMNKRMFWMIAGMVLSDYYSE